ncbi:PGF-pre-PGF domain-containing protein [Methanolobus sp. WCC4]|uniref:PGF-pre-PGF domain-containing protein n=1 Tax=Methanolobus sp. WCC4 TaxID=3125784 RepID=UPI0030F7C7FB
MCEVRIFSDKGKKGLLLLVLLALIYSCIPVTAAVSEVSVLPSSQEVCPGEEFDIYIYVEPECPVAGAQLDISYDSELVQADIVDGSEFFEQEGASSIFIGGTVDNSVGTINGLFAVTLGKAEISTAGNFAIVSFTAQEDMGDCTIGLSNVILSDCSGNPIAITVNDAQVTVQNRESSNSTEEITESTSSGGGGGGGGDTDEKAENIAHKEVSKIYVTANTRAVYNFSDSSNPIASISYTSLKNSGFITSTVEVLNDVSTTVSEKPDGIIYRNINIWVGKEGYATESNVEDTRISFTVLKQWMQANDVGTGNIHLNRYHDGKWNILETELTGEDQDFFIFEAKTPGFSPFAITADVPVIDEEETEPVNEDTDAPIKTEEEVAEVEEAGTNSTETSELKLAQNSSLYLLVSMSILLLCRRRNII